MGSKTPEGHQQQANGGDNALKPANPDSSGRNKGSASADLDRGLLDGGNDDDEDDDDSQGEAAVSAEAEKKKKRKSKKKKKSKSKGKPEQTVPPTIPLAKFYPNGDFPHGEFVPYENLARTTGEEERYDSRMWDENFLKDYRHAAEIHRQVRQYAQKEVIKPGASFIAITQAIEEGVYNLTGHQGKEPGDVLNAGMGFPTGLCVNEVAAHWTPNPGGKDIILQAEDVLSVDFGVHVNGRIVDSAFTVTSNPTYDPLLEAVRNATNTGIAAAGIDARMKDIGAAIQEVMESYEVDVGGGKVLPVKAINNITGHNILQYRIHGDKQIPFVKNSSRQKMEEGEVFAIETFGSTGRGYINDDVGIYGYARQEGVSAKHLHNASAKALLKTIEANFGTLPFCRRYLERLGIERYHLGMKQLIDNGIVQDYPPMVEKKGSHVAQFEHTILLHSGGKEVISRGDDY
ncbi:hypothetical protein PRZ48_011249 [Zasmidium cellare]|uniref:Methionine aminopeptidase 2 n=1 Tax=Zasmidium cellare TaxID=395010 RepID=A0ABR0EBF1_ZASCE|nr:hypothetical protein PRZ48_011249 [Zasmidium cellare]